MRRTSLVHLGLGLGLALSACQSDAESPVDPATDSSSGAATEYSAQTLQCSDDAKACAAQCLDAAGIDPDAFRTCGADLTSCVQENPGGIADCIDTAKACFGIDVAGSVDALTQCLASCSGDFGDCVPEPPMDPPAGDVGDAVACAQAAGECVGGCAQDIRSCKLPAVLCDLSGLQALAVCIRDAGRDPAAIAACVQDALADICQLQDVDLSCFEDARTCFGTCASDAKDCLDGQ